MLDDRFGKDIESQKILHKILEIAVIFGRTIALKRHNLITYHLNTSLCLKLRGEIYEVRTLDFTDF